MQTRRNHLIKAVITMFACLTMFVGCGGCDILGIGAGTASTNNTVQTTTDILNNAILNVERNSASWQMTLQDAQNKLTDSTQSTVRSEVTNLLQQAEAGAATEIKCIIDFLGARVFEGLERIKEEFLHKPVDPPTPAVCAPVPEYIDLHDDPTRRNVVRINGYNLNTTPAIQAFRIEGSSSIDETQFLFHASPYELTLNLGSNGIPVTKSTKEIDLVWQGNVLTSIPVIDSTPLCQTMNNVPLNLASDTFIPMVVNTYYPNADRDFNGNGPHVSVIVNESLTTDGNVEVLIVADFKEIGGDHTEAFGETTLTNLVSLAPGWKVQSFSDDSFSIVGLDHNPSQPKETVEVGNGWVSQMVFSGFEGSTAAGGTAQVEIQFKTVYVNEVQTQGCQSS